MYKVEENLITKNLVDFQNTSITEELFILASVKKINVIEKARLLVKKIWTEYAKQIDA